MKPFKGQLFKDQVAVVTGAASGIGLGLAKEIVSQGGIVALFDKDKDRLNAVSADFPKQSTLVKSVDVTSFEEIQAGLVEVKKTFGSIHFMFNNAGIGGTLPILDATMEQWDSIIKLNLYGVINGVMAVLPLMKEQKSGYIINTSSISGIIPFPGQALYNTTKFAVTGFSLSLEKELQEMGINISIICPGMVKTRIFYKPILGAEAPEEMVKIPKEAISVEEAVQDIVKGIQKKTRIIITPKFLQRIYRKYQLK